MNQDAEGWTTVRRLKRRGKRRLRSVAKSESTTARGPRTIRDDVCDAILEARAEIQTNLSQDHFNQAQHVLCLGLGSLTFGEDDVSRRCTPSLVQFAYVSLYACEVVLYDPGFTTADETAFAEIRESVVVLPDDPIDARLVDWGTTTLYCPFLPVEVFERLVSKCIDDAVRTASKTTLRWIGNDLRTYHDAGVFQGRFSHLRTLAKVSECLYGDDAGSAFEYVQTSNDHLDSAVRVRANLIERSVERTVLCDAFSSSSTPFERAFRDVVVCSFDFTLE